MPEPFFQNDLTTLYLGNLREVLPGLPANSIDCAWPIITGTRCGAEPRPLKRQTRFTIHEIGKIVESLRRRNRPENGKP